MLPDQGLTEQHKLLIAQRSRRSARRSESARSTSMTDEQRIASLEAALLSRFLCWTGRRSRSRSSA